MIIETCGAGIIIKVEEKNDQKRLSQEAFVTEADGKPVGDGQHFVGVGVNEGNLKELIRRCKRCVGCPGRECDINTRTFQHPEPQNPQISEANTHNRLK